MQWGPISDWVLIVAAAGGFGSSLWTAIMQSKFASKPVVEGHGQQLAQVNTRLNALEKAQTDQPDIHELSNRIERLHGDFRTVGAQMSGLTAALETHAKHIDMLLSHEIRGNR